MKPIVKINNKYQINKKIRVYKAKIIIVKVEIFADLWKKMIK